MKPIEEIHACIVDYGTFLCLADCLGKRCRRVSYYSPFEQEYLCIERCVIGDGMENFERVDQYMEPKFFNSVDLWIFPDIGYSGFQQYLRSIGKLVWGHMGADELELYRTKFLELIKKLDLPMLHSVSLTGLSALTDYLKDKENKWVKINRFRADMETWHHCNMQHSQAELDRLACVFGPLKEHIRFVVQDALDGDDESPVIEVGYDGWSVGGDFPIASFQGYEKKNQLYLGSLREYSELPKEIRYVNEKIAPVLSAYGYQDFYANEIRIKDGVPYHIDPTHRMAGQTMEHLMDTCTNIAEVIYQGAQGDLIKPDFSSAYSAEATLHYHSENGVDGWKTFNLNKEAVDCVKLYRCCYADGAYHFPPHKIDEIGVVIGKGNTPEDAIDNLKENFALFKDEPVSIELSGFADLIKEVHQAEEEGVPFSDEPMPDPAIVLETEP